MPETVSAAAPAFSRPLLLVAAASAIIAALLVTGVVSAT